jgi:hypothetical protein
MFRKFLFLLLLLPCFFAARAQTDTSHLRISLLTCGPGDEEVWEVFGHTAVRVVDSAQHLDIVFNYGMFSFGPNFELQFMRGKLLYCVEAENYRDFVPEYVLAKRSMQEQVLLLNGPQKEHLYEFLNWNAEPEHKYYKYDFFFDNCATRIRDAFPREDVLGKAFKYGQTVDSTKHITFRDIINQYFYRDHWTRLGVNILLGSRIDKVMTNMDIMFLPDYLRDGLAGATVNGHKVAAPPVQILPGSEKQPAGVNWALALTLSILVLTVVGLSFKQFALLGRIMTALLMLATGLLGVLILIMWFGTDHQGCANNYNLLWCLPTNIILVFGKARGRGKYSLIAIICILVSILLHITGIQGLTIVELAPLLLSLLYVYGNIYRKSKTPTT